MESNNKGKYNLKEALKKDAVRFTVVLLAAFVMAFNINSFVNAGGLYPGGATGLTIIIQRIAQKYFSIAIPFTPINVILNAVPVYIGFRFIGKRFTLFSMIMVVANGIFVDLLPHFAFTNDELLAAVFGGLLNAVAITMCLNVDATSGGTDFISIFLSQKKGIDTFPYILAGNTVILAIAGYLFGWDKALYSMIFQFVTTTALHTLYRTYQQKTLFIITDVPDKVCSLIYDTCGHGATLIDGEGSFAHKNKKIVYSIVSASDTRKLIPKIKELDPGAFINSVRTEEITGNFYMRPRD
ncbi:MAG: YitT family protein [Butyrivibrio sp.]|uniref:YitT family protein n=1 Tax=Butyrivibrio sp. TaxID=28121 RepID=UPI001B6966B9|nr:YitT family protein [Butyrivibrio sp.]MBP3274619.1 YitT family protein [Butyrivibrio sp.]MBP3278816.1 YitT family protein [Butyrivibrio sp.]MBP3784770.1 YitT family protein [Butyrivibrio sp.]